MEHQTINGNMVAPEVDGSEELRIQGLRRLARIIARFHIYGAGHEAATNHKEEVENNEK